MAKTIAIVNNKGGVGKTTTTINLAAALVQQGCKVLCVDLDPQGDMGTCLGYKFDGKASLSQLLVHARDVPGIDPAQYIRANREGIDYIACSAELGSDEVQSRLKFDDKETLKTVLCGIPRVYDYILIDCKSSLDTLLSAAMVASDGVIIPVQAQNLSIRALYNLVDFINLAKENANPALCIMGILMTMVDNTNHGIAAVDFVREEYGDLVFSATISRRVEAPNSTAERKTLVSDPKSCIGREYIAMAGELAERGHSSGHR